MVPSDPKGHPKGSQGTPKSEAGSLKVDVKKLCVQLLTTFKKKDGCVLLEPHYFYVFERSLCENPSIYYVLGGSLGENPIIYYVFSLFLCRPLRPETVNSQGAPRLPGVARMAGPVPHVLSGPRGLAGVVRHGHGTGQGFELPPGARTLDLRRLLPPRP